MVSLGSANKSDNLAGLIFMKHHQVTLDTSQRDSLIDLIPSGTESARKLTRARILLKVSDESQEGPTYTDKQILVEHGGDRVFRPQVSRSGAAYPRPTDPQTRGSGMAALKR